MREQPALGFGSIGLLVVDDQAEIRTMIKDSAVDDGRFCIVGLAADADEALDLARQTQPEAVILDHRMPAKSGLDVLPELREALPQAVIILWSSEGADKSLACSLGATDALEKTTTIYAVLDAIAEHQRVN
jgi:DNA-binding response OmpR family regulator